jgi:hypothetical protein
MRSVPLGGVVAGAIALGLLGGSAMAATPPKARDVASARSVVSAITRFDQTALRRKGQVTTAARAMVAQVQAGCAGGIPASAVNGTAQQQAVALDLVLEGGLDLSLVIIHPLERPAGALAKRLDHADFSKRALSRGIHQTAKLQRLFLALKPGDVCADVRAAAADGFTADPPGTTASLNSLTPLIKTSAEGIPDIFKKLEPYLLTTRDRVALLRLKTVDAKYEKFAANVGIKWGAKLGSVLTGAPPAGGGTGGFPTNPPPPASSPAAMTAAFALR